MVQSLTPSVTKPADTTIGAGTDDAGRPGVQGSIHTQTTPFGVRRSEPKPSPLQVPFTPVWRPGDFDSDEWSGLWVLS